MRTLFVQPDTDLFYAAKESEQVVNLLDANLLTGSVRVNDLLNRVREIQPHLIIISSHGKESGVLLSDGIIGPSDLKKIFSTSDNLECVYLNTCSSVKTAIAIHRAMPVDFIFSLAEVPDQHAFVSMSTFAYHLSEKHTYGSAWFESRGGNGSDFMLLPSMIDLRGLESGDDMPSIHGESRPRVDSNGRLNNIHDEVIELTRVVYGDERSRFPGLIDSVQKLQKDLSFVRTAVSVLIVLVAITMIAGLIVFVPHILS